MSDNDDIIIEEVQSFEAIPEDMYPVVVSGYKKVERPVYKKPDEKEVAIQFEFTVLEGEFEGRKLFQKVRPKLAGDPKPSNLYQVWSAIEGKRPAKIVKDGKETFDFHLSTLLNRNLKVVTKNTTKGDRTFTNIISYHALKTKASPKEMVEEANKAVDEGINVDDLPF